MLNIGGGEIALILVVALLVLGPKRLPELARGIGKFLREFRRQTDEVRSVVEREFYKMDLELEDRPSLPPPLPETANAPPSDSTEAAETSALQTDPSAEQTLPGGEARTELVPAIVPPGKDERHG